MIDICPVCEKRYKSVSSKFCSFCGTPRPTAEFNNCTNPRCVNHGVDLGPDDFHCDICGALTVIGKKVDDLT